jgi:hypothetical protein
MRGRGLSLPGQRFHVEQFVHVGRSCRASLPLSHKTAGVYKFGGGGRVERSTWNNLSARTVSVVASHCFRQELARDLRVGVGCSDECSTWNTWCFRNCMLSSRGTRLGHFRDLASERCSTWNNSVVGFHRSFDRGSNTLDNVVRRHIVPRGTSFLRNPQPLPIVPRETSCICSRALLTFRLSGVWLGSYYCGC